MRIAAFFTLGLIIMVLNQPLMGSTGQASSTTEDSIAFSQEVGRIVDSLRVQFGEIEDYQVRLAVSLKMPGLRMPKKRMTLSFKQPDKIHIKARGFAMLPKSGIMFSPDTLLAKISNPTLVRADGCNCLIIEGETRLMDQIQPHMAVTVDTIRWVITNISTRLSGEEILGMETTYLEVVPGIFMPEETNLRFEIAEELLKAGPRALHSDRDPDRGDAPKFPGFEASSQDSIPRIGEATIRFSRYKVNQGLDDALFVEEE